VRTLERIGRDAVGEVARALADPERETRRRAAELLERLPHAADAEPAAQARLTRVLEADPEWIVRAQAALALGARGARDRDPEPARRALERALSDADAAVAASAADGLARLGDPLAVPALIAGLERGLAQGDLRLVRALESALEASSGDPRRRDLDGWRSWWYEHRDALLRARRGG
jgi:HEAT repeat protein